METLVIVLLVSVGLLAIASILSALAYRRIVKRLFATLKLLEGYSALATQELISRTKELVESKIAHNTFEEKMLGSACETLEKLELKLQARTPNPKPTETRSSTWQGRGKKKAAKVKRPYSKRKAEFWLDPEAKKRRGVNAKKGRDAKKAINKAEGTESPTQNSIF